ncbi:putative cupin 2 domain-containing protein [Phaeoacremonium minimum UCRPA7]|uniref:Putative cupin 2 domain-containing protein n=1 Tax=Phaeoacremonium minimum (strain UCR-PA7) TaxID=1286976 RepID=R8BD86_PHAM7|nr:putative cupin 2 domain-containing protein [Phaeoacremonium minimum UCRPA7]EON97256.1 putative cupin 2 domain-containing protein [Phaeoacremonium minimum UCRPA7]
MVTLFHVTGAYIYVDPDGNPTGVEDVFSKLQAARKHYEAVGLGAGFADQFKLYNSPKLFFLDDVWWADDDVVYIDLTRDPQVTQDVQPKLKSAVHNSVAELCFARQWDAPGPIQHELHSPEETTASYIAYERERGDLSLQQSSKYFTHSLDILKYIVLLNHLLNR